MEDNGVVTKEMGFASVLNITKQTRAFLTLVLHLCHVFGNVLFPRSNV